MNLTRIRAQSVAPYIAAAAGDDLAEVLQEVAAGIAEAWRIDSGRAYMVTRLEQTTRGRELVVVCFQGQRLREYAPQIVEKARAVGCQSIRFHTSRRGMGRMLEPIGFGVGEVVYRLNI